MSARTRERWPAVGERALVVAGLFWFLAGCHSTVPMPGPSQSLIDRSYDDRAIRGAIGRALDARRFIVEAEDPQRIVARLEAGQWALRIEVVYDADRYVIRYVDSAGLDAHVEPSGRRVISSRYVAIVRKLDDTIGTELERPAREAREREARLARASRPVVVGVAGQPVSCRAALVRYGRRRGDAIFCDEEVDDACAEALLRNGHSSSSLTFCKGVDPACAVAHLDAGRTPASLSRCRP